MSIPNPNEEVNSNVPVDENVDNNQIENAPIEVNEDENEIENVPVVDPQHNVIENVLGDDPNNEFARRMGLARTRLLDLDLNSPEDPTGSTCSTAGTDKTPTLSTMSTSSGGASDSSLSGFSKSLESVGNTPLDSPQLIQAILDRRIIPEDQIATTAESDSSTTVQTSIKQGVVLQPSEPVVSPTADDEDKSIDEQNREGTQLIRKDSSDAPQDSDVTDAKPHVTSVVPQSAATATEQHPIPSYVRQDSTPGSGVVTPGTQEPSPAGSVEPSRQSSIEQTDSSISFSERSRDTDNADADVSNLSPIDKTKKKKVLGKLRPQNPQASMSDIMDEFFPDRPQVPVDVPEERGDTLDDADTIGSDSQSVRSSIPERGASVIFPSGVSYPNPPDQNRRAISAPLKHDVKSKNLVNIPRRAVSEIPDDSRYDSDLHPLSESPDVSLPTSPDREVRAVSLPPSREQNVARPPLSQRRALSEVKDTSRSTDIPPSASPDDVPLPSPLVSSSRSSSQHESDVCLDSTTDKSIEQNGASLSTDSNMPTAEVDAIMPGLQGWMNQGAFQDDRHLTSDPPGPLEVNEESNVVPVPVEEKKAPLSDASEREDSTSILSSMSELTCSEEMGGFSSWIQKGGRKDDSHLTTVIQPTEANKPKIEIASTQEKESSKEKSSTTSSSVSRLAVPTQVIEGSQSSSEMQVETETTQEKDTSKDTAYSTGSRLTVPTEVMEGSQGSSEMQVEVEPITELESSTCSESKPHSSRNFPRSAKAKQTEKDVHTKEARQNPKRKRVTAESRKDSSDSGSTGFEPHADLTASPEDDMATKKYCSEYNRPITRRITRSHSTGSVRDSHLQKRELMEWKKGSTKDSPEPEEKDSNDEKSDDE